MYFKHRQVTYHLTLTVRLKFCENVYYELSVSYNRIVANISKHTHNM